MEVVVNKQLIKNILFILFAVCLCVMNVEADGQYCDGNSGDSYLIKFHLLEIYVNDDNSFRSVIHLISPKDLLLEDAVNSYQADYTEGFQVLHEIPFLVESRPDLIEAKDETLIIQHTQPPFLGQTPTKVTLQINKPGKLVSEKPLFCFSFTLDVPSDDLI